MSEVESKDTKKRKFKVDWLTIFVIAVIAMRLFNVFTINSISGTSMYPTLQDGQIVVGSNYSVLTDKLFYNDIVVTKVDGKMLIKRIVALPGDRVSIKDGVLRVNYQWVQENYAYWDGEPVGDMEEIILEDDEYFVMGDNRLYSRDSREFGPVKKSQIISKIFHE